MEWGSHDGCCHVQGGAIGWSEGSHEARGVVVAQGLGVAEGLQQGVGTDDGRDRRVLLHLGEGRGRRRVVWGYTFNMAARDMRRLVHRNVVQTTQLTVRVLSKATQNSTILTYLTQYGLYIKYSPRRGTLIGVENFVNLASDLVSTSNVGARWDLFWSTRPGVVNFLPRNRSMGYKSKKNLLFMSESNA